MVGYQLGTLHVSRRYIGVKRAGEWGIHSAGMEGQQFDTGGPPGQFDGGWYGYRASKAALNMLPTRALRTARVHGSRPNSGNNWLIQRSGSKALVW